MHIHQILAVAAAIMFGIASAQAVVPVPPSPPSTVPVVVVNVPAVTYDNVLQQAASQNSSVTADSLRANLAANGADKLIQANITAVRHQGSFGDSIVPANSKLGWGGGSACDLTCTACADCATGAGQCAIEILAAFASAGIACVAIIDCPIALASASVASLAAIASFCNGEHQSPTCSGDCAWHNTDGLCPASSRF